MRDMPSLYSGLDLVASSVVITDDQGAILHANAAAETLLDLSRRNLLGQSLPGLFSNSEELSALVAEVAAQKFSRKRLELVLERTGHDPLSVNCQVSGADAIHSGVVFEFQEIDQQLKLNREEQLVAQNQMNRELIRNLAHEIKNPLGGIRGAAQLLERELPSADLKEYTQVVIKEADRLQVLVDRLLAPHRRPHVVGDVNIHEVLERVRSLVLAEYPDGLLIQRDYDVSLPEFRGDREQLIQAVLNITQNAAQALARERDAGSAKILLRTRAVRQVTLHKQRYRLALDLHVIDNGPGIAPEIADRIFFPLVSGREGGSGLGLTLAQTFIDQHFGVIECDSKPGATDFRILIPLP
jgi:two-component system, NtrC family, nitrogen regulation sensor histidine kinase GlnL